MSLCGARAIGTGHKKTMACPTSRLTAEDATNLRLTAAVAHVHLHRLCLAIRGQRANFLGLELASPKLVTDKKRILNAAIAEIRRYAEDVEEVGTDPDHVWRARLVGCHM